MASAFPLCPLKEGQRGRKCLFILGVGAGNFLVVRRIFSRISPNLPEKVFVQLLPTNFLPQRSLRPFFGVTSKTVLHVFLYKTWAPFFEVKQFWAPLLPDFQGFCPDFQQIKTFGVRLHPLHPQIQHNCFS